MTRRSSRGVLLHAVLLSFVLPVVLGADASGTWIGTVTRQTPAGEIQPACLILSETNGRLSGSAGPSESDQRAIKNGRVDGDCVRFAMKVGDQTMLFDLRVTQDEMTGSVTGGDPSGGSERLFLRAQRR